MHIANSDKPVKYYNLDVIISVGYRVKSLNGTHFRKWANSIEIGYCIGIEWWNKKIVSEAFSAIISFAFRKMNVNRIVARHDTNNPYSGKVMIKCGLKYEGTLRQADWNNQGIIDVVYYSILASEYKS